MIKYKKRKKIEKIWAYMRRNRVFAVSDLIILFDTKENYLRDLFRPLQKAGYILACNKEHFARREYRFVNDTGPKPPVIDKRKVYDRNVGQLIPVEKRKVTDLKNPRVIMKCLKNRPMKYTQLLEKTGLHKSCFVYSIRQLMAEGVVVKDDDGFYRLA